MRRGGRSCRGWKVRVVGLFVVFESVLSGYYRGFSTEVEFEFVAEQMRCFYLASPVTFIQFYPVSFNSYGGHCRTASGSYWSARAR